jgi:hypothetical protein
MSDNAIEILEPPRDAAGRWLPGRSPNPGGRPPIPEEVKAEVHRILAAASPDAARRLAELVHDEDPRIAAIASGAILDRILGKPVQAISADVRQETVQAAHLAALQEINARRLARLAEEAKEVTS